MDDATNAKRVLMKLTRGNSVILYYAHLVPHLANLPLIECPGCLISHNDEIESVNVYTHRIKPGECLPNYCLKCVTLISNKMEDSIERLQLEMFEHYPELIEVVEIN